MTHTRAIVLLLVASGCSTTEAPQGPFPLLPELAGQHLEVTTRSGTAQSFFDQGLTLYWAFDHEEARRSFQRAAELDPELAMAYWGIALTAGPHINNATMDPERERLAHDAITRAMELRQNVSPFERELIEALNQRYAWPPPEERRHLDEAWARAMGEVWRAHPDIAEAGALYAEALMDLTPWDLWTSDGQPKDSTPEILSALEATLALDPQHVGANHLAIHAWEASPTPERALVSADRLRTLVPGASHLVHMPAHIDIRLGHYDAAVRANQAAVEAARARVQRTGAGGFYAMYRAHNYHFLVYAAQFDGRCELAMQNARELLRELPAQAIDAGAEYLEGFAATPLHVLVRFGKWNEILAEPAPPARWPTSVAFWHYARGLALSALGRVDEAAAELDAFETAYAKVPESYTIGNNPSRTVLDIGREMLRGELEYRRGNFDRAFEHLRLAVSKDEALRYDEPWGWFQPPAHALGALLLERGRIQEAEDAYRRDLARHPGNGWALKGLHECQVRSGLAAEAAETEKKLRAALARADVEIEASCYCRVGER
jgi:tetratricopeptide (TPR) repeat protein